MRLQWACRISALTLGLTLVAPLAAPTSEKIVVDGSTGVMPLVVALAKAYQERYPAVVVEIGQGLGTKARLEALEEGKINIALASHGLVGLRPSGAISSCSSKLRGGLPHHRRCPASVPGALADPTGFLAQLADVGIDVRVETEELGFDFQDFELAWEVLAGVTTAQLPPERRQEAKEAVQAVMWPHGRGPRHFRNVTQFLVGRVAG